MASSLTGVAAKLEQLPRTLVEDALQKFKDIALIQVTKSIGSNTMHLHTRRGRRPVKLDVSTNLSGQGELVNGYANGKPAFAWAWLESGTKPHVIGKGGRTLKAPTYDHPVKGPIHHPGSRGKRTWTKAIAEFQQVLPDIVIKDLRKAVDG